MTFFNESMDFRFALVLTLQRASDRIAQRMNPINSGISDIQGDSALGSQVQTLARSHLRSSQIGPALEEVRIESQGFEESSVLYPSMKQLLEWWLGTWRDFHWVWSGKLLVLMGCWRWWEWCCNRGGQRSQLSRFPKPRQLNATRPCEPPGPQGREPEGDGTEFTA